MKLSTIAESTDQREEVLEALLQELEGHVSESFIDTIRQFHLSKIPGPYNNQNVTNRELWKQLLNGERLLAILEPCPDPADNHELPEGVVDCGTERSQSEIDGKVYLVGPVAAEGYEHLWDDVQTLPKLTKRSCIAHGLAFGYDPIAIMEYVESDWQKKLRRRFGTEGP